MPHVTPDEVRHVALLARLALSDAEVAQFQAQLERILGHIAQLQTLKTDDVAPTSHVLPLKNVLRDDAVCPGLSPDAVMSLAPARQGHFVKVPRIIE